MGFKTILVHLGPDAESDRRMKAAVQFAATQDARLRALYVVMPSDIPGLDGGASLSDAQARAARVAEPVRTALSHTCEVEGVRYDWMMEVGDPGEHLALHARYADAVIISQDAPKGPLEDFHADLTEFLPFASSAAVIILPRGRDAAIDPRCHVLVAWKSSKEAAAAVRDALPLLKEAQGVTVLSVQHPSDKDVHGAGISRYLLEHGVHVELKSVTAGDHEVAQAILAQAREVGAGLIVMGIYGHNRQRVRILGGVSKHVLTHSPVPLLVTH